MSEDQGKPLRLFVDPFAAWRELALKTAQMIAASAQAGAASASGVRVAVIDERQSQPRAPTARPPEQRHAPKAMGKKKHKKRAKRR